MRGTPGGTLGAAWLWFRRIGCRSVKTGERTYCLIGQWQDAEAITTARPAMIATLNSFRDTLEPLGEGLGVTDAVSGETVLDLPA